MDDRNKTQVEGESRIWIGSLRKKIEKIWKLEKIKQRIQIK